MREKGRIFAALPVILLISLIFFTVVQFRGDMRYDDPLYVSLRSSPLYAKNGWQPENALISNPDQAEWGFVLETFNVGFRANSLPVPETSEIYGVFSTAQRDIEQFTIFIPFYISEEQYGYLLGENILIPALSFAAIGENWEVFINGNSIAQHIYLDENGRIYRFQSMHGVTIPFSNEYLSEGENSVVIRLLGARSGRWTGLIYTSGDYYFGSNKSMSGNLNYVATVMICTVLLLTALHHLLVFFLNRLDLHNLIFGGFSTVIAVYYFFRLPIIYHLVPNSEYVQRVEYLALYFSVLIGVIFLEYAVIGKLHKHTYIYGAVIVAAGTVQLFMPIWFMYDILPVWRIFTACFLTYVVIYDLLFLKIKAAVRRSKSGESARMILRSSLNTVANTEAGNIFLLALAVAATALFDILDSAFFHMGLVLFRYGYLGFAIGMTYVLSRKSTNRYIATVQVNVTLEEAVRQRTEELERQIEIAEAASEAKSSFLAKMSHELRTPMTAVMGMSAIAKNTDDMEKMRGYMVKIDDASTHLLGVINDILDMSKIESGKVELSLAEFDFEQMIAKVVSVQTFLIDEKKQSLFIETSNEIPRRIVSDEQRLAQAITNLLSNAVKFTPEYGRISLTSRIVSSEGSRIKLELAVADTGIGISDEDKKRVFSSFEQADENYSRKYGGTGLGLAISKNIVEMMGGSIWIESEPGKGSRVAFTVWVENSAVNEFAGSSLHDSTHTPIPSQDETADIYGIFHGKNLLLVEDIIINQEIVIAMLEDTGISITCVENGEDACKIVEDKNIIFDIILMDLHMPVVDGYEATERIRALDDDYARNVPIIALTANVFREDVEKCLEAGMNDHFGKPIDIDEMIEKLRHYFDLH